MKKLNKPVKEKKLDTSPKESSNIISQTVIYSLLVFAYIVVIWYPYIASVGPENEAVGRTSTWSHIICIFIFLPTLLYIRFIIKHFKEINKFRFIVYPTVYIVCFILFHAWLMTIDPVLLWYGIITIPAGIIWFIVIMVEAISNDMKDRINEKNGNNIIEENTKSKK